MSPSISVIIPTYNRSQMLALSLPSYIKSNLVQEVWIIDDGSSSENWERIQQFADQDQRIRCVHNERNLGAPATRNRGISLATGDLLLLSEDDLELGENHLEIMYQHMNDLQADIIAGRRIWMRAGENKEQAIKRTQTNRKPLVNFRWLDVNSLAIADRDIESPLLDATMLMHRRVVEKVRYYEPFGGPSTWREESDFQLNALLQGFKLVFCPHVAGFHHARASASYGKNQIIANLHYLYRIYRNNRLFLRRHTKLLKKKYPQSLVLGNVELTSILYFFRKIIWFSRAEALRYYLSRKHRVYDWK